MAILALTTFRAGTTALFVAAAGLGAACGGPDLGRAAGADTPVRCSLALEPVPGGQRLEARILADRPVKGTFTLRIARSGAGGIADIRQDGAFSAAPDAPGSVGNVTLDPGGRLTAVLDLDWEGRRTRCSLSDPVEI